MKKWKLIELELKNAGFKFENQWNRVWKPMVLGLKTNGFEFENQWF